MSVPVGAKRVGDYGRSQGERAAPALDPATAPVDERTLPQFLVFAREYARLLNFHELDGSVSGDWQHFFDVDMSFLLAEASTLDLRQESFLTVRLLRRMQWQSGADKDAIARIYLLARRIDHWYARVQSADHAGLARPASGDRPACAFTQALESLIRQKLAPALAVVLAVPHWRDLWEEAFMHDSAEAGAAPWYRCSPWAVAPAPATDAGDLPLRALLSTMTAANASLGSAAAESLQHQIDDVSDHPAHTTLYIAFGQLLEALRDDLNQFTGRHLDYYYRNVLALGERGGRADSGYVMMQLAPHFPNYLLAQGSLLAAGKDAAGADVLYATQQDIVLNRASVASLCSVFVAREPGATWVNRILAAPAANSADGFGAPLAEPAHGWQTFGNVDPADVPGSAALNAQLGFSIASPALALAEGKRHVRITFTFDQNSLAGLFERLGAQARTACSGKAVWFSMLFRDGLAVAVSGARQWIAVERFFFRWRQPDGATNRVDMLFTLPPGAPAVVANGSLGSAADPDFPTLRLLLNPLAPVCLYSAFAQAVLERIDISVDVRGLADLQLAGSVGPMSAAKPFYPFGSLGECGAYFELYHPELGKANISRVRIALGWLNLPYTPAGFKAYFDGYGDGFDTRDYLLALDLYSGRRWMPVSPGVPMFVDGGAGAPLASRVAFAPPHYLPYGKNPAAQGDSASWAPPAGTVRLTFAAPGYGFGQSRYQQAFSERAIVNAQQIYAAQKTPPPSTSSASAPTAKAINPPLVPKARSISCDYVAGDSLSLVGSAGASALRVYDIYPFGSGARALDVRAPLFEDDGYDGRLYIGLAGMAAPQSISLHFQFREQAAACFRLAQGDSAARAAAIAWRYLSDAGWRDFDKPAVQSSTLEFTRSGIIKFDLPRDISSDSTSMPTGLYWIEARANGATLDTLTIAVLPQAVAVTRCAPLAGTDAPASVPAATIKGLVRKTPEIASVVQAYPTGGGAPAESAAQFRTRVSARLRHKERACQPGDMEQLVLSAFAAVRQAKCIGFNNSRGFAVEGRVAAGDIVLALVPAAATPGLAAPLSLPALAEVAYYLRKACADTVRTIWVRNLDYEYVKVFVNVEFIAGADIDASVIRLNAAIADHLAPWLRDSALALLVGAGCIRGHQLADFIRKQPYVARIGKVVMSLLRKAAGGDSLRWVDEAGTAALATPWSVFVPASRHGIKPCEPSTAPLGTPPCGIGSLTVNADLLAEASAPAGPAAAGSGDTYFIAIPSAHANREQEPS